MKANKFIATMAVVLFWANSGFAQNQVDVGLQEEINQESGQLKRKVVAPAGGVVILNNQNAEQSSAQATKQNAEQASVQGARLNQQPVTVVEATPLIESRAEQIRKARQNTEIETEQKIVEKLEVSRMEDEKKRADRLFGNRLDSEPQPVVVAAPAPVIVKKEETVVVEKVKIKEEAPKTSKMSIGAGGGLTTYSGVSNIQSNGSFGLTIGSESSDGMIIEGSFMYSNSYVQEYFPLFREMQQYNIGGALKYSFLKESRIRPFAGVLADYVNRRYHNRVAGYYYNNFRDNEVTTNAVDLGVTGGLDFMVNESLSVGADLRYSMNVWNQTNNNMNLYYRPGGTPVEQLSYYSMMLNAKMRF